MLDLARRSHTAIYTIGLGLDACAPRPTSGEFSLRRVAQDTGGRLFTPKDASGLTDVYAEIADELTNQYIRGYPLSSSQRDGRWRRSPSVCVGRTSKRERERVIFASASSRQQDLYRNADWIIEAVADAELSQMGSGCVVDWVRRESLMLRALGLGLLLLPIGCVAPRAQFAGMTMPSPDGCFVQVWEAPNLGGASDYINGPRVYPSFRDMPGGRLWQNRIRSATVGPAATVTVWSDENFQGNTLRLLMDTQYSRLPEAMTAQIESMAVECARSAAE